MKLKNDAKGWGLPARILHWAMAAAIIFLLGVGFYMSNFVDDLFRRFELTQLHKSWGFVVFSLALMRVAWRLAYPVTPDHPEGAARWEAVAAQVTHVAFYALMILMPLSGWLMASASTLQDDYNIANSVFGWFNLPDPFVPGDKALETAFHTIHFYGGLALSALLVVHAGAALKHHFVDRDPVLARMIRGR